jgi:hypothetical protein
MKRILLFLFSTVFMLTISHASQADLFSVDSDAIYTEMAELVELEAHVAATSQTYSELQMEESAFIANLSVANGMSGMHLLEGPPLGIPSFLWGFCLGVPGLAVVYFITEDSEETKKALWGCVVSGVISTVVYFVWVAAWTTTAAAVTPY